MLFILSHGMKKPFSGNVRATRQYSNRPAQLHKLNSLEISGIASRDITLSRERTAKTLIR